MQRHLLLISFLLFSIFAATVKADDVGTVDQLPLQDSIGCKTRYATTIEISKGYLSGISVLVREEDVYRCVL